MEVKFIYTPSLDSPATQIVSSQKKTTKESITAESR